MMTVRKNHSTTMSAIGLTSKPVRSASSSLIVGRSVTVKIVASTADQTISRTRAHGTSGRGEGASSWSCIAAHGDQRNWSSQENIMGTKATAKPLSSGAAEVGGVAEWLKAAVC